VPDTAYGPREDRPAFVLLDLKAAGGVQQASFDSPIPDLKRPRVAQNPPGGAGGSELRVREQAPAAESVETPAPSTLDQAAVELTLEERQVTTEIATKESTARKILQTEPRRAVELIKEAQTLVDTAGLPPATKARLENRLNRAMADCERYIQENRAKIELDEQNASWLLDSLLSCGPRMTEALSDAA